MRALQMHVPWIKITDEPGMEYTRVAEGMGITVEEAMACPKMLFGSCNEIAGRLKEIRQETGINYFSFGLSDVYSINKFAKAVIKPLRAM
ncbi:hypothetical protein KA005_63375 [bacterium]|nr:hypothetical protein [bacterium]